jgi:hypothetical protein
MNILKARFGAVIASEFSGTHHESLMVGQHGVESLEYDTTTSLLTVTGKNKLGRPMCFIIPNTNIRTMVPGDLPESEKAEIKKRGRPIKEVIKDAV